MSELPPYLSSVLWFGAAACLILLLLVIFGYHLYQRSRFKAMAADGASVAQLAARKESLLAEVAELRTRINEHKAEQDKLEAERHQQELARVDLAQLEKQLAAKRNESQHMLARMAELDMALEKRRQFHARLDGEIKSLEEQRQELAPLEKYVQDLREELDMSRARLAQVAQEEVRAQSLQTQAQVLRRELQELTQDIEPLREERAKLRQFIEQARHATAVRNEQLQDQKRILRALEGQIATLELKKTASEEACNQAIKRQQEVQERLEELKRELAEQEKQANDRRFHAQGELAQLEMLMQRKEEQLCEVASLQARKAALQKALAELAGSFKGPEAKPLVTREGGEQPGKTEHRKSGIKPRTRGKLARPHARLDATQAPGA